MNYLRPRDHPPEFFPRAWWRNWPEQAENLPGRIFLLGFRQNGDCTRRKFLDKRVFSSSWLQDGGHAKLSEELFTMPRPGLPRCQYPREGTTATIWPLGRSPDPGPGVPEAAAPGPFPPRLIENQPAGRTADAERRGSAAPGRARERQPEAHGRRVGGQGVRRRFPCGFWKSQIASPCPCAGT